MNPVPSWPNGLVYYTEEDIARREHLIQDITRHLQFILKAVNRSVNFQRVETPAMVPVSMVNAHLEADFPIWRVNGGPKNASITPETDLALRPESTRGTYTMFDVLYPMENSLKKNLPLCLWQSGLSFRQEQDATFKHLRFKQFYQLEYQLAYSEGTKVDYHTEAAYAMSYLMRTRFPHLHSYSEDLLEADRPFYSSKTTDIYLITKTDAANATAEQWECVAISTRKDFKYPILEVSVGLDRLTYLSDPAFIASCKA